MIGIIDYGAGNIGSICWAFIIKSLEATKLILPGVGSFE